MHPIHAALSQVNFRAKNNPISKVGRRFLSCLAFTLSLLLFTLQAHATALHIPVQLILESQPGAALDPSAPIERRLAQLLREQFDSLGLDVRNGFIIGEIPVDAYVEQLDSVCLVPLPKEIQTDATIAHITIGTGSEVVLDLDNLDALQIGFHINGTMHAATPARVIWGQAVPFVGNCETIGRDSGQIDVSVPFQLDFGLTATVTPKYDAETVALVLDKNGKLAGDVQFSGGSITPDFGTISLTDAVINGFERYLLRALKDNSRQKVLSRLAQINLRLDGRNAAGQLDPKLTPFNGRSAFPLVSDPDDRPTVQALIEQLGLADLVIAKLANSGGELLLQLAAVDGIARRDLLDTVVADLSCQALLQNFAKPLARIPLYAASGTACAVADPTGSPQDHYFNDPACSQEVAFTPTNDAEFCASRFGSASKQTLGNGAAWQGVSNQVNDPLPGSKSRPWTMQLSNRLDVGTASIAQRHQPYVKQLVYKSIAQPRPAAGACQLEMRVYKSEVSATNLRPLLAIHGGSWRSRGFSFLGLEASIPHFTDQGFVVFAPFYRLTGDTDGNTECNSAMWSDLTSDVEDALQWVNEHASAFGATAGPVTLFGQSAGAHLAAWLTAHQATRVDRALLFYPPLDVIDFLGNALASGGSYENFRDFGVKTLTSFYGAQTNQLHLDGIDWAAINYASPPTAVVDQIPDSVFDLRGIDSRNPPVFLWRCAVEVNVDLAKIDPAYPPAELLACLKSDLSSFILENAFIHLLTNQSVPLRVVHGSADDLVPAAQAVKLCNARDGGNRPIDFAGDQVLYDCSANLSVGLIQGAGHALDLGLCAGSLCPGGAPGTPLRAAAVDSLDSAYTWVANRSAVAAAPLPGTPNPKSAGPSPYTGGGGGNGDAVLLTLALLGAAARMTRRPFAGN